MKNRVLIVLIVSSLIYSYGKDKQIKLPKEISKAETRTKIRNRQHSSVKYGSPKQTTPVTKPEKSIIQTKLDTTILFGLWGSDPDDRNPDFSISKNAFNIAGYEGKGKSEMPYILKGRKIIVFYNNFIQEGRILKINTDSLCIHWKEFDNATVYRRWK